MTSLVVPKNVSFVGEGVIANCSGLTSIDVENGNSNYNSDNKCNAIIETVKGILIGGCKNTIIPEGTTELDSRAFQGCLGLSEIVRTVPVPYKTFFSSFLCISLDFCNFELRSKVLLPNGEKCGLQSHVRKNPNKFGFSLTYSYLCRRFKFKHIL